MECCFIIIFNHVDEHQSKMRRRHGFESVLLLGIDIPPLKEINKHVRVRKELNVNDFAVPGGLYF